MYRLFRKDPLDKLSNGVALSRIELPLFDLCLTTAAIKDHHSNIDSIRLDYIDFDSMFDLEGFLVEFKAVISDQILDLSEQRSRLSPKDIKENIEKFNSVFYLGEFIFSWYRVMPQFLSAQIEGPFIKIEDNEVVYFKLKVNYDVTMDKYGEEEDTVLDGKKVIIRNLKETKNYKRDNTFYAYFRVVKLK